MRHIVCRHAYNYIWWGLQQRTIIQMWWKNSSSAHIPILKKEIKQKKVQVKYSPLMFHRVSTPPNPLFSALILHCRIPTTTNLRSPCPMLFLPAKSPPSPHLSPVSCSKYCILLSVSLSLYCLSTMYLACPPCLRIGFQPI